MTSLSSLAGRRLDTAIAFANAFPCSLGRRAVDQFHFKQFENTKLDEDKEE